MMRAHSAKRSKATGQRPRSVALCAVMLCVFALVGTGVRADEGGVPFWFSGSYASLAAVPATPGWSLPTQAYYYDGSASGSESFPHAGDVEFGLKSRLPLVMTQLTYAPDAKLWGGQPAFGLGFGYGKNSVDADLVLSSDGTSLDRSDSVWGFTDLYPIASVAWSKGVHNWMTYLTGDIPVGAYDSDRLANIGIGHAAIDAGGGYTYLSEKTGWEFSGVAGLTYNFENTDTDYQNGIDSHLDWAASRFLSEKWEVGLAGYVYYQLTDDSGSGAVLGPFKSRVAAIGPEIGYAFKIGGLPAYANLRGYKEFWAENRLEGFAVFATVAIPLGQPGSTRSKAKGQ